MLFAKKHMPALRINMRKLKDALRLKFEGGQSHQQIAGALGLSKGVVTKYAGLAVAAGLDWPAIQPWTKPRWSDACWRPLAPARPMRKPTSGGFTRSWAARA